MVLSMEVTSFDFCFEKSLWKTEWAPQKEKNCLK